mgnify:CR=1 FL=1|jgi:UDP-4-amino-4,6-dideoxy-N-acetyl-beta-L-altrosamine transaminase
MGIDYSKQSIDKADILKVEKALKDRLITTGNKVPVFEKKISNFVGSKFSVAVNSATSALHIACMALNLKKNDFLWTSCNTFVASVNCGIYCGAKIDLVDIDKDDLNLSLTHLTKKLEKAKKEKKIPKILIPVHFSGYSCHMEEIYELSKFYGFKIIEDASHAFGGKYKDTNIGSCKFSHITVFSFHPTKIITTIEGGVACTNSKKLGLAMMKYRSHGIQREKKQIKNTFINYYQDQLGYNYRMNDIQAALGISQLNKVKKFIKKRKIIATFYSKNLNSKLFDFPSIKQISSSTNHLFVVRLKYFNKRINRDTLYKFLNKKRIGVNIHYIPLQYHPYIKKLLKVKRFKNSEKYYSEAISLPIHPELTISNLLKIMNKINIFNKK